MRILIMAIGFLLALMTTADAAVYQQGVVYVIYDEEGDKSVTNKADINANGVPDVIEDLATQVNAARELFKDVFKYPDPFESERFKNVTSIEVDIDARSNMKSHGNAYSGARKSKHDPNERAIHIRVANDIEPHKHVTPEHEYFHLIQYGATYFRNGWFLEGMARWSQDAISKTEKYPDGKDIPFKLKSKAAEDKIFQGGSSSRIGDRNFFGAEAQNFTRRQSDSSPRINRQIKFCAFLARRFIYVQRFAYDAQKVFGRADFSSLARLFLGFIKIYPTG